MKIADDILNLLKQCLLLEYHGVINIVKSPFGKGGEFEKNGDLHLLDPSFGVSSLSGLNKLGQVKVKKFFKKTWDVRKKELKAL